MEEAANRGLLAWTKCRRFAAVELNGVLLLLWLVQLMLFVKLPPHWAPHSWIPPTILASQGSSLYPLLIQVLSSTVSLVITQMAPSLTSHPCKSPSLLLPSLFVLWEMYVEKNVNRMRFSSEFHFNINLKQFLSISVKLLFIFSHFSFKLQLNWIIITFWTAESWKVWVCKAAFHQNW